MQSHLDRWAAHTKPVKKRTGPAPEKLVEKAIREAFRLKHRVILFKTDAGAAGMRSGLSEGARGYSGLPAGFSDLLGVVPGSGRAMFIECKAPGRKPTALQEEFLARRRAEGAIALWADSVDSALTQFEAQVTEVTAQELHMVAQIREALGDNGRRMFPELLEWCRGLVKGVAA